MTTVVIIYHISEKNTGAQSFSLSIKDVTYLVILKGYTLTNIISSSFYMLPDFACSKMSFEKLTKILSVMQTLIQSHCSRKRYVFDLSSLLFCITKVIILFTSP